MLWSCETPPLRHEILFVGAERCLSLLRTDAFSGDGELTWKCVVRLFAIVDKIVVRGQKQQMVIHVKKGLSMTDIRKCKFNALKITLNSFVSY